MRVQNYCALIFVKHVLIRFKLKYVLNYFIYYVNKTRD